MRGMRRLYHIWLDPGCRKIRLILAEKNLDHELKVEMVWERREAFMKLNPAGDVPVLIEPEKLILADHNAIAEYLDEEYPDNPLMGETSDERAEVRRLNGWFDRKFNDEVTKHLVSEKVLKRFLKMGQPKSEAIRAASYNLRTHLDYIGYLAERRNYLAGASLTMADLTAAAHISIIDYLGDIAWDDYKAAKHWYMQVKSRKSFRPLLEDRIAGMPPAPHYTKLDF